LNCIFFYDSFFRVNQTNELSFQDQVAFDVEVGQTCDDVTAYNAEGSYAMGMGMVMELE
jgi:hypothetical protein